MSDFFNKSPQADDEDFEAEVTRKTKAMTREVEKMILMQKAKEMGCDVVVDGDLRTAEMLQNKMEKLTHKEKASKMEGVVLDGTDKVIMDVLEEMEKKTRDEVQGDTSFGSLKELLKKVDDENDENDDDDDDDDDELHFSDDDDTKDDDNDTKDDDNDTKDDDDNDMVSIVYTTADGRVSIQKMSREDAAVLVPAQQALVEAYTKASDNALEQGCSPREAIEAGRVAQVSARESLDPTILERMRRCPVRQGALQTRPIPGPEADSLDDMDESGPVGTLIQHTGEPSFGGIFSHGGNRNAADDAFHPLCGRICTRSEMTTPFEELHHSPWMEMLSTSGYLADETTTTEQKEAAAFYKTLADGFFFHGEWSGGKTKWRTAEDWKDNYKPTIVFDVEHFPTSKSIPLLCIHRAAHDLSKARHVELEECASYNEAVKIGASTFWVLPQSRTPVTMECALAYCLAGKEAYADACQRRVDIRRLPFIFCDALNHYNKWSTPDDGKPESFNDVVRSDFDPAKRHRRALLRAKGTETPIGIPMSFAVQVAGVPGYRREQCALDEIGPNSDLASTVEGWAHTLACRFIYEARNGLSEQINAMSRAASLIADEDPPLSNGDIVYLHSLPMPQLNGQLGTVVRLLNSKEKRSNRYVVRIGPEADEPWAGKCFAIPWLFLGRAHLLCGKDRFKGKFSSSFGMHLSEDVGLRDGWTTFSGMDTLTEMTRFDQLLYIDGFVEYLSLNPKLIFFFHRRGHDDKNFDAIVAMSHESEYETRGNYRWIAFRGKAVIKGFGETDDQVAHRLSLMGSPQHQICECCKTPISLDSSDTEADRTAVPLVCGHIFHESCLAPFFTILGRGACPICDTVSSNIFGCGSKCYSCEGFEFEPPLVKLPRYYMGKLTEENSVGFEAVDDDNSIAVDAADTPPPPTPPPPQPQPTPAAKPPPKRKDPKPKKTETPGASTSNHSFPVADLPSLGPAPLTSEEMRAIHEEREAEQRRQAAYRRAVEREQIARERWQKAENEAAKAAAAEARRLPDAHGPKDGVAGSRRVKTAEEAAKHAFWTSPEGKQLRWDWDQALREKQECEAEKRRAAEAKERAKKNRTKEDIAEQKYAWYKHVDQKPEALSLADAAARRLTARNLGKLNSSGAGPSTAFGDADAESMFGGAESVATHAWEVDFTQHALYRMGHRSISKIDVQRCLKHGNKHRQRDGRMAHLHPCWSQGIRLVVITESDLVTIVTAFDKDNNL